MQVNWTKILKYKEKNINDENVFYLLSYFFDDFIFDSFDKDGNIVVTTKDTGMKVTIEVKDTTYKYKYDETTKKCKQTKTGSFELLKRFYEDEEVEPEVAFLVKSNKEEKCVFPGRRDYELTKENIRYSYDEYEGDKYREVIAHANKFYLFPHKKKVSLKPDISVGVVASSYNNEKKIYKTRLLEDSIYQYDLMSLHVITPISTIAHNTVTKMFTDDDDLLLTKRDVYKQNKIGF